MPFDCPDWPPDWPEIEAAAKGALQSGGWGRYHSPICRQLQQRLSHSLQVPAARLCCSGTAALEIALRALRVGPGDEVILAAYDYPGNFRTIELLGARPVLVDVSPETASIDPCQLAAAAGQSVRAVIATHLYGQPSAIESIAEQCRQSDWRLIEDACQVQGMVIGGRPAGGFGDFATLSFGGSKLISAGSGGALLAGSDRLAARLGGLLDRPGDVYPISPLQAAVIEPQLDRLDEMNALRTRCEQFLQEFSARQMPRWQSLGPSGQRAATPAFYKVAWLAESQQHRARIIAASEEEGVPIGAGFRSMSTCSERRCRKPVATPHAQRMGETLFVLDHRALLLEPTRRHELADSLLKVYKQSL